ncbi:phage terminase, large subunit, PBSX family [Desulfofundulus kuznetsovii DSM 6115]|uniref:Phage terminase, large subunit, PBSX family n=1 Tax=Desulfofundulus kuznetsovii (strain DSM 6115 / VKM B-1805 / 17) TaxID=760568 RepID=A0AAU8PP78_DESK7|nr:phage terminase, large subunit, PBSX family [Desulfofundulus kuznetsovii DSM 6115]
MHSILRATKRLNLWHGAVRSGKTVASLIRFAEYLATAPPGPVLIAAKTERSLKRNILDVLASWLPPSAIRVNYGKGEAQILGRTVYLASANDERSETKLRGVTLAGAYGDEITTWPESFFRQLLARLSIPGAAFFGTTNPDSPRHWLKRDFLDRANTLDLAAFHFSLFDNPYLSPAYIEALKREYTGLWYRRYILGQWVAAEGVIFDSFDPSRHVTPIPPFTGNPRHVAGIDYGTSNPTCFIAVAYTHPQGPYYAIAEHYYDPAKTLRQRTDEEHLDALQAFIQTLHPPPEAIYFDPSAASLSAAALRRSLPLRKADNRVLEGIRFLHSLFTQDKLFIHPSCQTLIDQLVCYSWDPKAQEKGEDKPLKQDDHSVDSLRYCLVSHFSRPLGTLPKPKAL